MDSIERHPIRYAGIASSPGGQACLCLTVGDTTATLDLPAHMRFRLKLEPAGPNAFRIPPGAGPARLELDFSASPVTGVAHDGDVAGAVTLWPELPLDRGAFEPCTGAYRITDARELFLGIRGDGDSAIPFLLDGDELVRLHPTGSLSFVSERGELVHISTDTVELESNGTTTVATRFEPYHSREASIAAEGATLAGTLFVPHGEGPFPAVALLHGSNPGERGFYQLYAHYFASNGVAALAYDRRGSGASTGSPESTLEIRARDAAAALDWLRGQPGVDADAVGLWAFSNGTWSAPMAAARMGPVSFMIVTGAAGVSPAESEIHRKLTELRGWGIAPGLLDEVASAWRTAYACIAGGRWPADVSDSQYDTLIERLHTDRSLAAIPLANYAVTNPWLAPIPPPVPAAKLRRFAGQLPGHAYDPIDDYSRIACPVLFLVGENDPNTPAAAAARVREALARAGNTRATVEVVPGAGHYINIAPSRVDGISPAEAASELHGLRFVPGYLGRMPAWVRARSKPA